MGCLLVFSFFGFWVVVFWGFDAGLGLNLGFLYVCKLVCGDGFWGLLGALD